MKNLTLLTDLYELTMMQGYYYRDDTPKEAVFDLFYRDNPNHGTYSIFAGLEQIIEYIEHLSFSDDDIAYLRSLGVFEEEFLHYLENFSFTGSIYSVEEGSVILPNEPILKVIAPMTEAQFIETALLNIINHQSLIATKAARIKWSAKDDDVSEFGLRRAHGPDAGVLGARAAYIGGCDSTSNVLAGKKFNIPVTGTHAHSWIMSFANELEAFRSYVNIYPERFILLVDTYDTIHSGLQNAIKVFDELKAQGKLPSFYGIRLDSGDLSYLSKKARILLDEAGYEDAIISASSDLDEYLIRDLKLQGSKITLWGVGTSLITSKSNPAFGGVYKLSEVRYDKKVIPKIKLSDNPAKITNPGNKKILRIYDTATGKIKADLLVLADEVYTNTEDLILFDPNAPWKKMTLEASTYTFRDMHIPIFIHGKRVYTSPSTSEIKEHCKKELETLWDESKRLTNPQPVYMDLSKPLYDMKQKMMLES